MFKTLNKLRVESHNLNFKYKFVEDDGYAKVGDCNGCR